jgi:hypothetical protein
LVELVQTEEVLAAQQIVLGTGMESNITPAVYFGRC